MAKVIPQNEAERIKPADNDQGKNSLEKDLLLGLLKLALKDFRSGEPALRSSAEWWIYEDRSEEVSFDRGYISFRGVCQALDLDPDSIRRKLKGLVPGRRTVRSKKFLPGNHGTWVKVR